MIIYNIRNNGPYEYDKFILNIGQLYNYVEDEKIVYSKHYIHNQLKYLNEQIKELTKEDSLINKLVLINIAAKRIL